MLYSVNKIKLKAGIFLFAYTILFYTSHYFQRMVIDEILRTSKVEKSTSRRYSPEWLLNCLILYIKSPKTYNFLRNKDILPLPCKSTIKKYLKNSNVGVGFDEEFFSLFEKKLNSVSHNNPSARYGILAFDEIQVRRGLSVNVASMTFDGLIDFGNHSNSQNKSVNEKDNNISPEERLNNLKDKQADHALVFMFSSLSERFHQPIGIFTSKNSTPSSQLAQLIVTAIIAVEKAGGKVMALVCDGAKTNRGIWKHFGINGKVNEDVVCSFENPYEGADRKIYIISDVPHLLKCIRNNLFSRKLFKVNYILLRLFCRV